MIKKTEAVLVAMLPCMGMPGHNTCTNAATGKPNVPGGFRQPKNNFKNARYELNF